MSVYVPNAASSNSGDKDRVSAERTRLAAAKLKLYQSTFIPGPTNVVADFVAAEASFTGYVAHTITWNPVSLGADGKWQAESDQAFYQATDAVSPNTIGGAWLETAAGALVEYIPFPIPVNMTVALAQLTLQLALHRPEPDNGVLIT